MNVVLPPVAVAAWWGTAWLRGRVSTADAEDALVLVSPVHSVELAPEIGSVTAEGAAPVVSADGSPLTGVEELFVRLGRAGATGLGIALPIAGDPLGLGGPRGFNDAALEAGGALLAHPGDLAAVPWTVGAGTTWTLRSAYRRHVPDVGEADRGLRRATLEGAQQLAQLDVAAWSPEAADALLDLRHEPDLQAPPGTPTRCVSLAARGLLMTAVVETALADHGGAMDAREMAARRDVLEMLGRHARRAVVAACSAEVWPDH